MQFEEAQAKAGSYLSDLMASDPKLDLVLLEEATLKFSLGWAFFYQSRRYIETGDVGQMLAGNAPLLVDRRDGSVNVTGTASETSTYIRHYEITGDPHIEGMRVVVIEGFEGELGEAGRAIKARTLGALRAATPLSLLEAKALVDDLLSGTPETLPLDGMEQAGQLRQKLEQLGWKAHVERRGLGRGGSSAWKALRTPGSIAFCEGRFERVHRLDPATFRGGASGRVTHSSSRRAISSGEAPGFSRIKSLRCMAMVASRSSIAARNLACTSSIALLYLQLRLTLSSGVWRLFPCCDVEVTVPRFCGHLTVSHREGRALRFCGISGPVTSRVVMGRARQSLE